jgi:hypothetical protein
MLEVIQGYEKTLDPKKHLNMWRGEKSKETKEFMKVGEVSVQHNRYDGHCA